MPTVGEAISNTYLTLSRHYGTQSWWPAESNFEIMIGAVLTQNTAWTNVEKALLALKADNSCNADRIVSMPRPRLATLIRSSGYYNQKAERLQLLAHWYLEHGGYNGLVSIATVQLRAALLALKGIGNETADDILLYAFNRPVFVIDAYTRRLFARLGLTDATASYQELQDLFTQALPPDHELFKQYHALIVTHAKQHCRKRPLCTHCPLQVSCCYDEQSQV